MKASDIPEVRSLPLFRDMESGNFGTLMRGAYVQTFPPQIELVTEGDRSDFLHIVVEGTVEMLASWDNRDTTMAIVRPLGTFILAATIRDAPYLMSARTMEKSRLVLIPSEDVRDTFERDSDFARAVVAELAQCYRASIKNTKNLKLRSSLERLANYILRQQIESEGARVFELDIEKRRLASILGMTAENLSRAIKTLQPYGVKIEGSRVTVSNQKSLLDLAKPTPLIDDPTC
ncbi:cyclic nucleotide-binding domain-containing protein [Frigidibacter sp. ROC022]|uniref:cyclic nucleotide-binding domain-containing protein n=1 Tax=Frigidibacter sp. ROC022 TaxID=2971796 RepID=UPI00215B0B5C|nr:cyclic nucleotide-binding domain-containing protein [Frigidibacter sp. ROC022]MCR8726013.1 cyclic nucleotide-binding domain-containing protein [Frigidibacter sp. ROC022]